jgi:hypothetical protein
MSTSGIERPREAGEIEGGLVEIAGVLVAVHRIQEEKAAEEEDLGADEEPHPDAAPIAIKRAARRGRSERASPLIAYPPCPV